MKKNNVVLFPVEKVKNILPIFDKEHWDMSETYASLILEDCAMWTNYNKIDDSIGIWMFTNLAASYMLAKLDGGYSKSDMEEKFMDYINTLMPCVGLDLCMIRK